MSGSDKPFEDCAEVVAKALAKQEKEEARRKARSASAKERRQAYKDLGMVRNRDGSYE